MNDDTFATKPSRNLWIRGLLMLLMGLAYQLTSTLLFFIALIQFVLALLNDTPNTRLSAFGRSLGRYQSQNASFLSFATEEPPFPFSEWPAGE